MVKQYKPGTYLRLKQLDQGRYKIAWSELGSHGRLYKIESADPNAYFKKYVGLYQFDEIDDIFQIEIPYNCIWDELNV
jgi:hypothetical protein